MGKYDGILLMSDYDGTLAVNAKVSPENSAAIKKFQDNGGVFVLASGRAPSFLDETNKYFTPTRYAVLLNGTVICDAHEKKPVMTFPFGSELFDFIDECAKEAEKEEKKEAKRKKKK